MAMNGVKMEGDAIIKPEPDTESPGTFLDDDDYEDTGELNIPKDLNSIWLTRVPKWLWEALSKVDDDEEVKIGTIKVWNAPGDQGEQEHKMKLSLERSWQKPDEDPLPRDYDLKITNQSSINTYVFSEKDMEGYKPRGFRGAKNQAGGKSAGGPDSKRKDSYRVEKSKDNRKKSIPKHTALAGHVIHELSCLPVENEEFNRLMMMRTKKLLEPKNAEPFEALNANLANQMKKGRKFSDMVKTGEPKSQKAQLDKAARLPSHELMDKLFACFSEYKYWSLKSLKRKLNQPEAYLREHLSKIATLIKSGDFAMRWTLNEESRLQTYQTGANVKDEEAPDRSDEDEPMEDAL
ncbi:transcription initiation factor IIF, beta subunit [Lineolata rhizophorae]|uniref:Transcription initiation factor IIF subunit beta n=1 Tax=Lineolata rhizophorae TaxID=578093 RepID=A0A6A6P8Z9_9PEZI|nr:transcription initiation factor IIF, beta subunit [Lineolata rhizophorae]